MMKNETKAIICLSIAVITLLSLQIYQFSGSSAERIKQQQLVQQLEARVKSTQGIATEAEARASSHERELRRIGHELSDSKKEVGRLRTEIDKFRGIIDKGNSILRGIETTNNSIEERIDNCIRIVDELAKLFTEVK